ncbi:MAG: sigma-70 family RNA polymerase sigma factor [Desulfobacterales bacterium]|nr:sigma-70 family RNA polymerase sigma factor [Desulfobacterales bacterium]
MKRLSPDEERILLYDCLFCCQRQALIMHYWRLVERTVTKVFGLKAVPHTQEGIEDMRNEIFLKMLENNCKKLWQYQESRGRSLAGWIVMIANQTVLADLRSKAVLNTANQSKLIPIEEVLGLPASENHPYDLKEQAHILRSAMDELPAKGRLILKMYYFHGLNFETIARYLKMKKGAVYTAKSRALDQLTAHVGKRLDTCN